MSDDALLTLATNTACEITALTVPCAKNSNIAVSMYSDDKAKSKNLPFNAKATALARACGHGSAELFGDAFVSRYHDDEMADIWERKDFTVEDSLPGAAWCTRGGGGNGGGSGSSLSNLMSKVRRHVDEILALIADTSALNVAAANSCAVSNIANKSFPLRLASLVADGEPKFTVATQHNRHGKACTAGPGSWRADGE